MNRKTLISILGLVVIMSCVFFVYFRDQNLRGSWRTEEDKETPEITLPSIPDPCTLKKFEDHEFKIGFSFMSCTNGGKTFEPVKKGNTWIFANVTTLATDGYSPIVTFYKKETNQPFETEVLNRFVPEGQKSQCALYLTKEDGNLKYYEFDFKTKELEYAQRRYTEEHTLDDFGANCGTASSGGAYTSQFVTIAGTTTFALVQSDFSVDYNVDNPKRIIPQFDQVENADSIEKTFYLIK